MDLNGLMRLQEPDYAALLKEAYSAYMQRHMAMRPMMWNGWLPDTSYFDYGIAPGIAKERGVSTEQVLYEHYRKRTFAANDDRYVLYPLPSKAYGQYRIPYLQQSYKVSFGQGTYLQWVHGREPSPWRFGMD
jgi:hypothetical protein